jgi:hypothetical protein
MAFLFLACKKAGSTPSADFSSTLCRCPFNSLSLPPSRRLSVIGSQSSLSYLTSPLSWISSIVHQSLCPLSVSHSTLSHPTQQSAAYPFYLSLLPFPPPCVPSRIFTPLFILIRNHHQFYPINTQLSSPCAASFINFACKCLSNLTIPFCVFASTQTTCSNQLLHSYSYYFPLCYTICFHPFFRYLPSSFLSPRVRPPPLSLLNWLSSHLATVGHISLLPLSGDQLQFIRYPNDSILDSPDYSPCLSKRIVVGSNCCSEKH